MKTAYLNGDKVKVLGPSKTLQGFLDVEYLEGHRKGSRAVMISKENELSRAENARQQWRRTHGNLPKFSQYK